MATKQDIDGHGTDPLAALSFAIEALTQLQSSKSSIAAMEATLLTAVLAIAEDLTSDSASPLSDRETAIRTACAEIGAALRVSDRAVQARLSRSWELSERFPAVLTALAAGQITTAHADAIVVAGIDLPTDNVREKFAALALDRAHHSRPPVFALPCPPSPSSCSPPHSPNVISVRAKTAASTSLIWPTAWPNSARSFPASSHTASTTA